MRDTADLCVCIVLLQREGGGGAVLGEGERKVSRFLSSIDARNRQRQQHQQLLLLQSAAHQQASMDRISFARPQRAFSRNSNSISTTTGTAQGRLGSYSAVTSSNGARFESMGTSGGVVGGDGFGGDGPQQQQRLSGWMPGKLSGCRQWLEVRGGGSPKRAAVAQEVIGVKGRGDPRFGVGCQDDACVGKRAGISRLTYINT